ncbi:Copper radical oxidase [Glomus cerebriforme]|uniref:Copper radical oxidase n=1 Tax=Glomus cerebriforme TaxID=658196 RepID=A0A397TY13_9GLOM|nr:Copper radical oxidase [Glomus cerebriforme]
MTIFICLKDQKVIFKKKKNSGVNAMHAVLVGPRKVVFVDKLEQNHLKRADGLAALSSEYDLDTNTARPLGIYTNTFCSAGSWLGNGTLVEAGGDKGDLNYRSGIQTVRLYDITVADWVELEGIAPSNRWYPAMLTLPNGNVMILGGSTAATGIDRVDINNPTYTIFPPANGVMVDVPIDILTNALPYNLYPMMHLIPNYEGRTLLFILANQMAIQYDLDNAKTLGTYPNIPGGIRSYPLTGTSIMLPLSPDTYYKPEIMVCGGNKLYEVTSPAEASCGRLDLSVANPAWEMDNFGGTGRVMPDSTFLVDGSILFVNGAGQGFAGYRKGGGANALWVNENPVLFPYLYDPFGKTYKALAASTIPRMYHSVSTLIPDGTVLIAGSNPQGGVTLGVKYPTEYRVEIFYPPYLYSTSPRPNIVSLENIQINTQRVPVKYGQEVTMIVQIAASGATPNLKACIIHHGFITHSQNFSQRYVYLDILNFWSDLTTSNQYILTIKLPPNPTIIAPGPSYMYVFNEDSPPTSGVEVLLQNA